MDCAFSPLRTTAMSCFGNIRPILFRPQILHLIEERDQALINNGEGTLLQESLEDHNLDVTSESHISIDMQMKLVETLLNERKAV